MYSLTNNVSQDPESIEIRECFDNYCVSYDDSSQIPIEDLRSALVQVSVIAVTTTSSFFLL
jgi:hypothetical protein